MQRPKISHPRRSVTVVAASALAILVAGATAVSACASNAAVARRSRPTLTIAVTSVGSSLNPSVSSGGTNSYYQLPAYDSLLHTTGESGATVVPGLASSFKWIGGGNKTFEITLNKGLRFSDGTRLNASAVKISIEHFKTANGSFATDAAPIASIATPNPTTVIFHLSTATPEFPLNLTENTGMGDIISPKAIAEKRSLGTSTDGAGPYELSSSGTVEGSTYVYTPNPHYYDPSTIEYSKIVIKVIANPQTALDALRSGEVDVSYGSPTTVAAAKAAGLHTVAFPSSIDGLWSLDQGNATPALSNVKVRQAIQYALNRPAIAKVITSGLGTATEQYTIAGTLGYDSKLNSTYPYDPSKAKQLLTEAGYPNGFTYTILPNPDDDVSATLAEAVQQELQAVGITVTIVPSSTFPEFLQYVGSGKYDAFTSGLNLAGMPVAMPTFFTADAQVNAEHLAYPAILQLAALASRKTGTSGNAAWEAVNKLAVDQAYDAPTNTADTVFYWNSKVSGVNTTPFFDPDVLSPTH
jgi:peptide/nickel transport system substrate-binding protein